MIFEILMYILGAILCTFIGHGLRQFRDYLDLKNIPGPLSLPILGTRWLFTIGGYNISKVPQYYEDMRKKYGPIFKEEEIFNVPVISIFDKDDIEKVLRSSGKYPLRPPVEATVKYRRAHPERYASIGLSNEQGEAWHFLRTSLTPALTSPKTIQEFLPQMEEISDDWCHLIKQKMTADGHVNNLEELAGKLGLEATCALVLGRRMGFLIEDEQCEVAKILAEAVQQNLIACRDTYYGLPLWKLLPTSGYKRLCSSEESIYECASELIRTADEATRESAVFQSVINANIDDREKRSAIVDLLSAGIHTFKNSLLFLLYQIATHPECQQKIVDDPTKTYLKACVMETFRLSPTVSTLARITHSDMMLSGYKVSAGSVVICQTSLACLYEKNFKDAKKFRPERWLGEEKKETANNAAFLVTPFGYGKRICPGKRYMEHMLPMILQKMVEAFVISVKEPMELEFELLVTPKGHVSMDFKERV